MLHGSALTAALRATTSEVLRVAGAYDAVVIGAGAAGGLAALLLTEAGLRVLVLEAGSARTPVDSPLPLCRVLTLAGNQSSRVATHGALRRQRLSTTLTALIPHQQT